MIGRRAIIGLSLMCALMFCAVAAQGAAAAGKGQTSFTCFKIGKPNGGFSDAHCDKAEVGGEYGHVVWGKSPTKITLTNKETAEETKSHTPAKLKAVKLKGFANVTAECTFVEGSGEASNSEAGGIMKASGSGTLKFTNAEGANCTTNQVGCTVKVAEAAVKAETVEGLAEEGHGLKFTPSGANFTTLTWVGSCGLSAFGAIPVAGSTTGTAHGEPKGGGATVVFTPAMGALTVGGEAATLEGTVTLKGENGSALVATTS